MDEAMRILVIKPSSMGDIFHIFPALELLQKRYPQSRFDFVIKPEFSDVLDFSPVTIDRRILFERESLRSISSFFPALFRLLRDLRQERYDLVIDFQGLYRSGLMTLAAKTKKSSGKGRKYGFAHPRERQSALAYTCKVFVSPKVHAIEKNFELARIAAGGGNDLKITLDALPIARKAAEYAATKLPDDGKKLVAIIPGTRWVSKTFDPGFFARIIRETDQAAPDNFRWVIIGAKTDKNRAKRILESVKNSDIVNLTGKTSIAQMIEILRRCDGVLSNDSGPMHAAAALGKPVAALFSSSDPAATGPYWPMTKVFRREELDCIGCRSRNCPRKSLECHHLDSKEIVNYLLKLRGSESNA